MQPQAGANVVVCGLMPSNGSVSAGLDYVFPNGLANYCARTRTRVLQQKSGQVYQRKPYPYSGYCMQWSPGPNQFEPGVGAYWLNTWVAQ